MAKREQFRRYFYIHGKLRENSFVTFEQLKRDIEELEGKEGITKRQFQRDLNDIRDLFECDIKHKRGKGYHIIEGTDEVRSGLLAESLDFVGNLFFNPDSEGHLLLEKRRSSGTHWLSLLLKACKARQRVLIIYQGHWQEETYERLLEPYAVKQNNGRWYLLAKDVKYPEVIFKTYGLDRIRSVNVSKGGFTFPVCTHIEDIYKDTFGILAGSDKPVEEVVLAFEEHQGRYIKTYPLHSSQELISHENGEMLFRLNLRVTYDFVMELLSYGETMKVLAPVSLQVEIKAILENAFRQYE